MQRHRWHLPVRIEDVPETGLHLDIVADADARAYLAELARLRELPRLEAAIDLTRQGAGLRAKGHVTATVGQTCVVTLEPIESPLDEKFEVVFVPDATGTDAALAASAAEDDDVELMSDGVADIGAVAAEFFLLGVDRYPRKPGAEFSAPQDTPTPSPFAVLAAFKPGGPKA